MTTNQKDWYILLCWQGAFDGIRFGRNEGRQ